MMFKKCYVDGDLAPHVTSGYQDVNITPSLKSTVMGKEISFSRARNPHSGCYFLNADQMQCWIGKPYFGSRDSRFIGPLESAATLGIMKTFRIYKPAVENACFLEIEHYDNRFLRQVRRKTKSESDKQS